MKKFHSAGRNNKQKPQTRRLDINANYSRNVLKVQRESIVSSRDIFYTRCFRSYGRPRRKPEAGEVSIRRVQFPDSLSQYTLIYALYGWSTSGSTRAVLNTVDHQGWPSHMAAVLRATARYVDVYRYKHTIHVTYVIINTHTCTRVLQRDHGYPWMVQERAWCATL